MGKLKDAHMFSNKEGSIAKFFLNLATYSSAMYFSNFMVSVIEKEPFKWWGSLKVLLITMALVAAVYFITRFIAYHTKTFPKTENREGVHGMSFIFLLIIAIVLLLFLV